MQKKYIFCHEILFLGLLRQQYKDRDDINSIFETSITNFGKCFGDSFRDNNGKNWILYKDHFLNAFPIFLNDRKRALASQKT